MNNTTHDHFREVNEMIEYIDRQKVLDLIAELQKFYEEERKTSDDYGSEMACVGSLNALTAMEDGLSDIPSADVRPVVWGEWKHSESAGLYTCSVCGQYGTVHDALDYNFCPHCGADMRKESN